MSSATMTKKLTKAQEKANAQKLLDDAAKAQRKVEKVRKLAMKKAAATRAENDAIAVKEMEKHLSEVVGKVVRPNLDSKSWKPLVVSGVEMWVWDVKKGTEGELKKKTARVILDYSMWNTNDTDAIMDSSVIRGEPVEFGLNEVIKGWEEGLKGMKVGGVRHLYIPAALAYGDAPKSETGIPAGTDLVFTVKLLDIDGQFSDIVID